MAAVLVRRFGVDTDEQNRKLSGNVLTWMGMFWGFIDRR